MTKLQPTAIQKRPNRWSRHWKGGERLYSETGKKGGRDDRERRGKAKERVAYRLGVGSDGEAAAHTEMKLSEKV